MLASNGRTFPNNFHLEMEKFKRNLWLPNKLSQIHKTIRTSVRVPSGFNTKDTFRIRFLG